LADININTKAPTVHYKDAIIGPSNIDIIFNSQSILGYTEYDKQNIDLSYNVDGFSAPSGN
jgi:hypothetical protein